MTARNILLASAGVATMLVAGASSQTPTPGEPPATTYGPSPKLPVPNPGESPGINFPNVVGWKADEKPEAPAGFDVTLFAGGLDNPRWLHVLPNGDVLVAESRTEKVGGEIPPPLLEGFKRAGLLGKSANRITLLRDADHDGRAGIRETFAANLNLPFGMWLLGDRLYVANTDAVLRFRYRTGDRQLSGPGEKILELPAGGYNNHWTRNIIANADGSKIHGTRERVPTLLRRRWRPITRWGRTPRPSAYVSIEAACFRRRGAERSSDSMDRGTARRFPATR